jgi:hypothetical protein
MIDLRPQVLLEGPDLLFGLTVSLRAVRGTESPLDTQMVAERCPGFRGKLGPTIGHYAQRDSSAS